LIIGIFAFFLSRQMASQEVINDSLRESEERFRLMVETSPFPLVLTRLSDHGVLYINRRASEMLGIAQEEAVGRSMPDYYDDPRQRVEFIKQVKESGFVDDQEFCLKRNNGKRFWALLSATTVRYCGEMALLTGINDISERKHLEDELKRRAITDSLTGIANRAYFLEQGNQQFQLSKRYGHRLSVMMIDIDFFKKINDTYGHHVGDIALQAMTEICVDTLREVDIFGRMGGEEFAVALPSTAVEGAAMVAERLRAIIEQADVPIGDGRNIKFTVSIGVAQATREDVSIEDALKRADEGLYTAKRSGRNRVEMTA
jgi:diguanylate cyclase (GGDEF)-like protein/PAS domain S-box-containing protein